MVEMSTVMEDFVRSCNI